jgi:hypothetical protein
MNICELEISPLPITVGKVGSFQIGATEIRL